jgi:hypothetical protein
MIRMTPLAWMIWMIRMGGGMSEVGGRRSEIRGRRAEGRKAEGGRRRTEGKEVKKLRGLEGKRWPRFHSTWDIILAAEQGKLPDKIMMTVHPQRWTDDPVAWTKELVLQNIKNVVKRILVHRLRR